jgi:hypothetical protein
LLNHNTALESIAPVFHTASDTFLLLSQILKQLASFTAVESTISDPSLRFSIFYSTLFILS